MDFYLQYLILALEFIAVSIVVRKSKLLYHSSLRLILIVIPFIFIIELIAFIRIMYFDVLQANDGNINYYNITTILVLILYYALYLENIRVPIYRKVFLTSCLVTFCFYIFNRFFIQTGHIFHTYSFTIGSVCLCLGIIFYIKEITNRMRTSPLKLLADQGA